MARGRRVTFSIDPEVAADLETLTRLVGIRQYKGRLVNLLLSRSLGPYQPAIARVRNGSYTGTAGAAAAKHIIRKALVAEIDAS